MQTWKQTSPRPNRRITDWPRPVEQFEAHLRDQEDDEMQRIGHLIEWMIYAILFMALLLVGVMAWALGWL